MVSKPDSPNWRKLLRIGCALLDESGLLSHATFGGGTALALRFDHRISWDVDLFLPDPQYLALLSPRLNDSASAVIAEQGTYDEQANFLKLALPEGEIDFIVAHLLTTPGATQWELEGFRIRVEEPQEILAKKLTYRGGGLLTVRDVFDLNAVRLSDPEAFSVALSHANFDRAATLRRLHDLEPVYGERIRSSVTPTESGRSWLEISPLSLARAMGLESAALG